MDIGKLKAFIVVAEELNFRRSAEILAMSQPPLTRLIAALETELGTKLFERTTRSVRLTAAGIMLLREAREIIAALARIETEVRAVGKLKTGILKIGFSRTAFMARLPAILEEFQRRFPRITLDLREEFGKNIPKRVRDGVFDVGFVEGVAADDVLASHEIAAENLGVLLAHRHRLAKRKRIEFHELADETIILHHRREAEQFYDRIAHLVRGMAKKPRIYVKGDSESCPILVALGKGVSLTIADAQNLAPRETRFVPIVDMFLPVRALWKNDNTAAQLKTFLSFIIEHRSAAPHATECMVLADER